MFQFCVQSTDDQFNSFWNSDEKLLDCSSPLRAWDASTKFQSGYQQWDSSSMSNAVTACACCDHWHHRAGANYFRLVRPLHALKCEQAIGVWGHAPPGKFFKIRHSEIASEAMFGPKKLLESPHL